MVEGKKYIYQITLAEEISDILTLINGCANNNRGCQEEMYHYLHKFGANVCYRYVQHYSDVEELLNESFIKFFKGIDKFDITKTNNIDILLKGWFKRIIINTCIDFLRRSHTIISIQELKKEQDYAITNYENGLNKIEYKEIIEAIRLLSPAYRMVFNLFVIEGMSHEEISETLHISVGASKSNLSKAKANLRKIILLNNKIAV
jgi:RNA polymerase sigma-70 factor (ECF subfamily)